MEIFYKKYRLRRLSPLLQREETFVISQLPEETFLNDET